jgi:hypothetical protein
VGAKIGMSDTSKRSVARALGYFGLLLALFAALTPGYFYIPGLLAIACGAAALWLQEGYLGLLAIGFGVVGTLMGFILTLAGFRLGK